MKDVIKQYATNMQASAEVLAWIDTTLAKQLAKRSQPLEQSAVEHIIDYLVSSAAPSRLQRMSYAQAKASAEKWTLANQKKGRTIKETHKDTQIIHDFFDGTKIVRLLTKQALQREGFMMRHCVGSYNPKDKDVFIYSYRDKKNLPHATFELRKKAGEITQIKGKGNGPIHPKYVNPILTFLATVGVKIRPTDMVNLGYYHIAKTDHDLVQGVVGLMSKLHTIQGETYLYELD